MTAGCGLPLPAARVPQLLSGLRGFLALGLPLFLGCPTPPMPPPGGLAAREEAYLRSPKLDPAFRVCVTQEATPQRIACPNSTMLCQSFSGAPSGFSSKIKLPGAVTVIREPGRRLRVEFGNQQCGGTFCTWIYEFPGDSPRCVPGASP